MKKLLWIMAALATAFIIGACSNAADSARAAGDDPPVGDDPPGGDDPPVGGDPAVEEGLDLTTLSSLDDIFYSQRENISVKLGLDGASSLSIKTDGNLPAGLSMDETGLITGTADAVSADVTSNFTVVADIGIETPITWTLKAPRTERIIANTDWTTPDDPGYSANDTITLMVLMAGGGGAGGASVGHSHGGGGGGGQVKEEAVQVTAGESISVTIGGGGGELSRNPGRPGGTTSFGTYLSAAGGGGGSSEIPAPAPPQGGNPGGFSEVGNSGDGMGASGTGKHGKTSTNLYSGSLVTLGGGGSKHAFSSSGGSGGGGGSHSYNGTAGASNTGGGGGGGGIDTSDSKVQHGGSGVVYVNY